MPGIPPKPDRHHTANATVDPQDELAILRAMLSRVAQGTAMFDAAHRLVGWNQQLLELLDLSDLGLAHGLTFKNFADILAVRGYFVAQSRHVKTAIRALA